MTCLAGIRDGNSVWLASDSQSTNWWGDKKNHQGGKIIKLAEGIAAAHSGDCTGHNVLEHWLDAPRFIPGDDQKRYVVRQLWPAIIKATREAGYIDKEARETESYLLVAVHGRLFTLSQKGNVLEDNRDFSVAGSGSDLARGSLISTFGSAMSPEERLRIAIGAAIEGNAFCGGEIVVVRVPKLGAGGEPDDTAAD